MQTIVIFLAVIAAVVALAPRVMRQRPSLASLRWSLTSIGVGHGDLAQLIQALFNSLVAPDRRTWWERRYVIESNRLTVVAHPADVAVLAPKLAAVERDLNAALEDRARADRLIVELPIALVGIESDRDQPQGRPKLVASPASVTQTARAHTPPPPTPRTQARPARPLPTAPTQELGGGTLTRLWPVAGAGDVQPLAIPARGVTLGRDPDLRDGLIDVDTISWRHAKLTRGRDGWQVIDLDSTNGTFVAGRRVTVAPVRHGDVIGLGRKVRLRFLTSDAPFVPTEHADPDEAVS